MDLNDGQSSPPAPAPRPDVAALRRGPGQLARSLGITVQALAERITPNGRPVNRRTLYKLAERGAPFDSEDALRRWLLNNGADMGPQVPALSEVVNRTLELAQSAPTAPAGQGVTAAKVAQPEKNADGSDLTTKQKADLATVRSRDSTTRVNELTIGEKEKVLLHRNRVARMTEGLAGDVLVCLTDLPSRLIQRLGDAMPIEHRSALRAALAIEVNTIRATITAKVPERLTELLSGDVGDRE